ncbi:OmpA family protein [Hymenobacter sp. 15J16-1T3B]|uniref:OmpA family protein n=1 Tax=Hymenobacter sp. 15J16-1T3B TaxID=2886941 RepID=UPI001D106934|nr:OmpA family protein [Hymenobacter sp. 15J16-1T3B]MCC3159214.1 OmpA family protein [Hymenobacter sp. 15J16-1T3B]
MLRYLSASLLLLAALHGQAQNVEFTKDEFKGDKESLKNAQKELKEANSWYETDPPRYEQALPHFLAAQQVNPNNAQLNFRIGHCYLNSTYKSKALPYLQKAYQLDPQVDARIRYMLGRGLHLNARWEEAIAEYKAAQPAPGAKNATAQQNDIRKKIQECESGLALMKTPTRAFIDNVGPAINTPYPEYGPVITADESVMLFTSRRDGGVGDEKDPFIGGYFEDIWQSVKGKDGQWQQAKNLGPTVNTKGHDAVVALSPDGQKLVTYVEDGAGDLYEADLKGAAWNKPGSLGRRINGGQSHESSAAYAPNGRMLYFVSNGSPESSRGGHDIWRLDVEGKGKAENLGSVINTPYDEDGIFVHPDGKTIYFSSQGHNSMGGYDIFKSEWKNGQWTKPENLGWPINTPDDDVFFVLSASGRHGYFASSRDDSQGSRDIYMITFLGPEKPPVLSSEEPLLASRAAPVRQTLLAPAVPIATAQVTILKGTVTDADSKQPIEATIELVDNALNQSIASFKSNSQSGRYLVSLPSGVNYGIVVRKEGYLFHSENFDLPAGAAYSEVVKDIPLKKLDVGAKVVLNNIFFDFDKATLRKESTAELERLVQLMTTEYPALRIEISGHTDNVGKAEYNKDLSLRRAKAVVDYLTAHGVAAARLTSAGYGDTQPVAPNTTKEGRQLNRRTEFKVVAK